MVFARFGTTCTNLLATLEPLYNFAVEKVKFVRQIACRIAKVLRWPSCGSCVGCEMAAIWGFPGFAAVASQKTSVNPALVPELVGRKLRSEEHENNVQNSTILTFSYDSRNTINYVTIRLTVRAF